MIIDDITRGDIITVLDHVKTTCALNDDYCKSCPYADSNNYNDCTLAHVPYMWQLDQIGGDQDDQSE